MQYFFRSLWIGRLIMQIFGFAVCGLGHLRNLRILGSGMSPRVCKCVICRLLNIFACPPLRISKEDYAFLPSRENKDLEKMKAGSRLAAGRRHRKVWSFFTYSYSMISDSRLMSDAETSLIEPVNKLRKISFPGK